MEIINQILGSISVLISVVLAIVLIRSSKSLTGSFFKKYYRLMTIAAVMFAAGFLIEVIRKPAALDYEIMEFFHHISLITGAVVLVYASIVMPKEAVKISEVVNTLQ